MADNGQRTEQPTPKRLEKARKDGSFLSSKEFTGAAEFGVFCVLLLSGSAWLCGALSGLMRDLIRSAFSANRLLTPGDVTATARDLLFPSLTGFLMAGAALTATGLGVHLTLTQFGFAPGQLSLKWNRLNPAGKLGNMPRQNLASLLQALFVLPFFVYLAYSDVGEKFDQYLRLPRATLTAGAGLLFDSLRTLLKQAFLVFLAAGAADLWRQRQAIARNLRMSKQEIREEAKEGEANPEVKAKVRKLRRDLLRRKMMKDVPSATAVVVNPTHFAVAIKYDINGGAAPMVVAKGKNYLALRIRQKAIEHQIPIVENPPLAQALYKAVEVGQEIPADLYRAVAEVLAYIYRLMGGRLPA